MECDDISIQLEKIELRKKKEIEKQQSYEQLKENLKKIENERLELIKKIDKK